MNIAFRVFGAGPPLMLVMGYRLSSSAWPQDFLAALSRRFTVIVFDNRGTGLSDKPVDGYALSNMAADACGLLDHLGIERANVLGYSMGGAIAQHFALDFPDRLSALALCATLCGGTKSVYARPHVVRTMHDIEGLTPDQAARRAWEITYSPAYLAAKGDNVEAQMRREIARPTPLHAADLQFQALIDFDCSSDLSEIRAPTLVLTGDLDQLVPPRNSKVLAELIPRSRLVVVPGCGHRVMWEASEQTAATICDFFENTEEASTQTATGSTVFRSPALFDPQFLTQWPELVTEFMSDLMTIAGRSMYTGYDLRFGDGKPVIVVRGAVYGEIFYSPFLVWLKALGYRPALAGCALFHDGRTFESALETVVDVATRIGRKAVIVAFDAGTSAALRVAAARPDLVSDVVAIMPTGPLYSPAANVHVHAITFFDGPTAHEGITIRRIRGPFWLGLTNLELQQAISSTLHAIRMQLLDTGGSLS
ncbi:MAG: alpha/beta fold hydrolase [Rhodoblastus sp.]|nr:alpha/beta fold hydrolase [Rhodoblastus sp.]